MPRLRHAAAALLMAAATAAQANLNEGFEAEYVLTYRGFIVGEIRLHWERPSGERYRYTARGEPRGLARLVSGADFFERSRGRIVNGRVVTDSYESREGGELKERWRIDDEHAQEEVSGKTLPLSGERPLDPLSVQVDGMLAFMNGRLQEPGDEITFTIVDGDELSTYTLHFTGTTTVEAHGTKYGAHRVERVHRGDRKTRFWLAPELDYFPVKLEQVSSSGTRLLATLRKPPTGTDN